MTSETPVATTSFVGRRRELTAIRARLIHARILTLTGPGGIGKTRLAMAIAGDRRDTLEHGTAFVPLHTAYDDRSIVAGAARALGLSASIELDDLVAELSDKRLLMVLDNCEHVLLAASALAETLARACPHLRILATSRTSLSAVAPDAYAVPPMSLPAADARSRSFDGADAVRLFVERAVEHDASFVLDPHTRAHVGTIVRATGGLPLAIEFAAAQLRERTVGELAETVAHPRLVSAWSDPSRPARQQTLESSLAWSTQLCTADERAMWARLTVFDDDFDIDAVEAVCTDEKLSCEDALDLVQSLVEQSMLTRVDDGAVIRYAISPAARRVGRHALSPATARQLRRRLEQWRAARTGERAVAAASMPHTAPRSDDAHPELPTAREGQVAALVAAGLTNRQIAARLLIAPRTVDGHVQHLLTKLGFRSRSQIAAWATQRDRSSAQLYSH